MSVSGCTTRTGLVAGRFQEPAQGSRRAPERYAPILAFRWGQLSDPSAKELMMQTRAPQADRSRQGSASGSTDHRRSAPAPGRAPGRRVSPFSAGLVARTSLGADWRLLLSAGVGILVAVVLICAVPLYGNLTSDIQLQTTINREGPTARNVTVQLSSSPLTASLRDQEDRLVSATGRRYLSAWAVPTPTRFLSADPMLLAQAGARALDVQATNAAQATLQAFDLAQARPHMQLVAGAWPQVAQPGAAGPYEALITQQMAQEQAISLNDVLVADQFGAHDHTIQVRVVGIWRPAHAGDAFWNGQSFLTTASSAAAVNYPIVTDPTAFTAAVSALPDLTANLQWVYETDTSRIDTTNMQNIPDSIGLLRSHLAGAATAFRATVTISTGLEGDIHNVVQQLTLLTLPLYVIVAQVVGLALLFVTAMAGLLVEGQAGYIATLKSRGASGWQLLGSYAMQGILLAVVAALMGPWLAGVLALALIRWFVPASTLSAAHTSTSYLLGLTTPRAVILPAAAGALLGVGAIVIATQRAARLDVLAFRRERGRSLREPLWRRYYLDVGLAVLSVLGYLELSALGTLSVREQVAQGTSSPLLLAAPGLLLLAGALLLLRAFPLVASLGARWAGRGQGTTGMLAFAQVARSTTGPNRLMLLLALSVGLGLFALTFDASLLQNAADRAAYQTGADVRLVQRGAESAATDQAIQARLITLPGVAGVTPVYRSDVTTAADAGQAGVNLLAIDPSSWASVAGATSWRADYADTALSMLMASMRQHQWRGGSAVGTGQAGDPQHPLWALVSQSFATTQHVAVGDQVVLNLETSASVQTSLVVGAIVRDFPSLYPARQPAGFVVLDLSDTEGALARPAIAAAAPNSAAPTAGPNEYWLKSAHASASQPALARALTREASHLDIGQTVIRQAVQASIASNPLYAGVRGLLLVGALTAAGLAVLGTLIQSVLAARQRMVQFAILRTIGMTARQLTTLLLTEQVLVYLFGVVGGTILGLALATATLPFLQFGDTSTDPTILGIPAYVVTLDPPAFGWFYLTLLAALVIALALAARYAAQVGLGKTLRLSED